MFYTWFACFGICRSQQKCTRTNFWKCWTAWPNIALNIADITCIRILLCKAGIYDFLQNYWHLYDTPKPILRFYRDQQIPKHIQNRCRKSCKEYTIGLEVSWRRHFWKKLNISLLHSKTSIFKLKMWLFKIVFVINCFNIMK